MNYHGSKLVQLEAKGNKWYLQVTMPALLQNGTNKQVRRSAGTTDRKEAERRLHRIAGEVYRDFDEQIDRLKPHPAIKFVYDMASPDPLHAFRTRPVIPKIDAAMLISSFGLNTSRVFRGNVTRPRTAQIATSKSLCR